VVGIGNLDRFKDFMLFSVDQVDNVGKYTVDVNFKKLNFFLRFEKEDLLPITERCSVSRVVV